MLQFVWYFCVIQYIIQSTRKRKEFKKKQIFENKIVKLKIVEMYKSRGPRSSTSPRGVNIKKITPRQMILSRIW